MRRHGLDSICCQRHIWCMLELLTTDAFANWFSALEEGPAEDVAATLEVIVQLSALARRRRGAASASSATITRICGSDTSRRSC